MNKRASMNKQITNNSTNENTNNNERVIKFKKQKYEVIACKYLNKNQVFFSLNNESRPGFTA